MTDVTNSEPHIRRLRVQQILVQPVLVWDDGEELTPAPGLQQLSVPLSQLARLVETLPAEVAAMQARLEASADTESTLDG